MYVSYIAVWTLLISHLDICRLCSIWRILCFNQCSCIQWWRWPYRCRRWGCALGSQIKHFISCFLGDDEKVLIWDVIARKRKHTLEDSGHRWGQITCLSWLENQQDNQPAVLAFGTARGYIVMYRQSRTEVGSSFLNACIFVETSH